MKNNKKKFALVVPFLRLYDKITEGDHDKQYYFSAGTMDGQVQKIYLGVCAAAMFRKPSNEFSKYLTLAKIVASNYGLDALSVNKEIWIIKPEYRKYLKTMMTLPENSVGWHLLRADLCGIPLNDVDFEYHHRKGFGAVTKNK